MDSALILSIATEFPDSSSCRTTFLSQFFQLCWEEEEGTTVIKKSILVLCHRGADLTSSFGGFLGCFVLVGFFVFKLLLLMHKPR